MVGIREIAEKVWQTSDRMEEEWVASAVPPLHKAGVQAQPPSVVKMCWTELGKYYRFLMSVILMRCISEFLNKNLKH